ncbi:MAG TPA: ATP-binding protein [Streptosporangiaceae bacterium]|nr:ATP-binding protein [Streptosporangiaceae bacterium]
MSATTPDSPVPDAALAKTPVPDDVAPGSAMCSADELRQLFLFEKLTDDQLGWLCREGSVIVADPGRVYGEGEPATLLYVLLSGTVVLSRRIGADDVETTRASTPGVYAGAFFAYLGDRVPQVYNNSMRVTEQSRFFTLEAAKFATLMTEWFPMAVHLLEGLFFGTKNTQEAVGQRERLLALGALSAGLTHELNNPAAAAVRATAGLRDHVLRLRQKLPAMASGRHDGALLTLLVELLDDAIGRLATAPARGPLETADLEDAVTEWLDDHSIPDGWEIAPAIVAASIHTNELDKIAAAVASADASDGADLAGALRWLADTVETELLLTEIGDSVARISSLVGAAKQYSQLDRAPYQVVDIHDLLDSTLAMLAGKIGDGVTVVREYDRALPRIPAFPGELNQVWTNLIDNAVSAMAGSGTLTIRTMRDRDRLLVEFGDTGPGVPAEIRDRIFDPFFTTKPVGQGTGLGLDISYRIVAGRHHGDLRVESVPGDTRFRVWLPIEPPGAT